MNGKPAFEDRPDEPEASVERPPVPKRGAFPTPRPEIEAAEPYVPPSSDPEPDDPEPDDPQPDDPGPPAPP